MESLTAFLLGFFSVGEGAKPFFMLISSVLIIFLLFWTKIVGGGGQKSVEKVEQLLQGPPCGRRPFPVGVRLAPVNSAIVTFYYLLYLFRLYLLSRIN